jgi:hypothetical protein
LAFSQGQFGRVGRGLAKLFMALKASKLNYSAACFDKKQGIRWIVARHRIGRRAVGGNAAQITQYLCRTPREIAPSLQKLAYCRTRKSVTSFHRKVRPRVIAPAWAR